MKLFNLLLLSLVFVSLFLFNNCEDVTDPADECEKTKWQEVKEPIFNLIVHVANVQYSQSMPFSLDTAQYIEFT